MQGSTTRLELTTQRAGVNTENKEGVRSGTQEKEPCCQGKATDTRNIHLDFQACEGVGWEAWLLPIR